MQARIANFVFYFFHEDYVKLKMMDFMVHKDAMKDVLKKNCEVNNTESGYCKFVKKCYLI
jgi:hypothetical protein